MSIDHPRNYLPKAMRGRFRRQGVIDARRVRFGSFLTISICLFATAVLCILAIWDYASDDTAWRAVSTLGVVMGTLMVFTFFNEIYGTKIEVDQPQTSPAP